VSEAMKYSMLNDDWVVSADRLRFESPPLSDAHDEQWLLFSDRIRNGAIEADITLLDARKARNELVSMEADLVFRYNGPEGFYYAGTSGFDTKFFLAKALPGPYFQLREYIGRRSAVKKNKTYRLRDELGQALHALGYRPQVETRATPAARGRRRTVRRAGSAKEAQAPLNKVAILPGS
jgi:hypothetical protein